MKPSSTAQTKKNPRPRKIPGPQDYIGVTVSAAMKQVMVDLAQQHNRSLSGECLQALQEYLERHNLWPQPSAKG